METMKIRGCHPRILRAVQGLYTDLRRVFRLNGAAGQWWTSSNGLVQGDPISMVMLNSLVTCVIESTNRIPVEGLTVRSYADDLSSVVVGRSPEEAKNKLRSVHAAMRSYVAAGCGELNDKKCFTFGNAFAKGILNPSFQHLQQFRIVGGSLVVRDDSSFLTQLENTRWSKWKNSIRRIRRVPLGWKERAKMMLTTQSQACFAQGTHGLVENREYLKQIRSDIMRSLWNMDAYSCSPLVTMALLVPVQLDPEFGCIYEGLRAIMRFMRNLNVAAEIRRRFFDTMQVPVDGPTARLRTLSQSAVLGELIYKLINGDFNEDEWLHMLREAWRNHLWNRVSRERSHHYAGAHEVDRIRTMKWYNQLQQVADNTIADTDDMEISQARAQLGVLRTIFAGGLLTPDRALRHRNKGGHHLCRCGLERESVEHVSWRCMQYISKPTKCIISKTFLYARGSTCVCPICCNYSNGEQSF